MHRVIVFLEGKKTIIGTLSATLLGELAVLHVLSVTSQWFQGAALLILMFTGISARLGMDSAAMRAAKRRQ